MKAHYLTFTALLSLGILSACSSDETPQQAAAAQAAATQSASQDNQSTNQTKLNDQQVNGQVVNPSPPATGQYDSQSPGGQAAAQTISPATR